MAILLAGSPCATADIAAAAKALTVQVTKDFSAAAVPEGTEAVVYAVGTDMAELPDFATLRGEFEALKGRQ